MSHFLFRYESTEAGESCLQTPSCEIAGKKKVIANSLAMLIISQKYLINNFENTFLKSVINDFANLFSSVDFDS